MTLDWISQPTLHRPALLAAFEGWNDAGDAATDSLRWLMRRFDSELIATMDADEYVDYQATRPHVEIVSGTVRSVTWPSTNVFAVALPDDRDLVVVMGAEPNLRWPAFCTDILDAADTLGCEAVVTLGALLADTPHSRPPRITGTTADESLLAQLSMRRSRYEGPTGIVGVLHNAAREAGFAASSLWVPVPHYVAAPPNPRATRTLLEHLATLLGLALDLTDLDISAAAWERSVADVVAADGEIAGYVARLEQRYDLDLDDDLDDTDDDGPNDPTASHPSGGMPSVEELPSGDALAADFERYLRDRDENA
ncbi:MAG TPA: PAC2 family protein [Acidimicrobiia bacterium]|nr:PAC2 family protein [Acidimicrobiia bacterium]